MYVKTGRPSGARGEAHHSVKFTKEEVLAVVRNYKRWDKKYSTQQMARDKGVCQASVYQIINGRSWSHVTGIKFHYKKPSVELVPVRCTCGSIFKTELDGTIHQRIKQNLPVTCSKCS